MRHKIYTTTNCPNLFANNSSAYQLINSSTRQLRNMNTKAKTLKNYILSAVCIFAANMVANAQSLVAGGQFMDLIQPMPGSVSSSSSHWGDVKPRWTDNGVEDAVRSYWGGNIVKGEDGKYHMYIAGWPENSSRGHATWSSGSRIYHIVADNPCGPYKYVSDIGAGHNPEIYKTGDTYVIYKISSLGYYKSKTLGDKWEKGEYQFDLRDRILIAGENRETSLSNCTFAKRQDGSFVMMDRGGSVWISRDGLQDPWHQITDKTTYSGNRRYYEDPVIWRDHLQYHMIVNDWNARKAYYNRSLDGRTWIVEAGTAYSADETQYPTIFSVHEDGTQERWHKYERPKVLQDEMGRAEYINFAVIDTEKSKDKGSDTHSSKNIVMPLVKPLVLEVLNSEIITASTTEIRVKVKAEAGFNPNEDLDLESLRFGGHGKVNYGNGFKASAGVVDGKDLIITFIGNAGESGITDAEFAPKMLGKKKDGSIAFGYASLPYVDYKPAILSALRPYVSVTDNAVSLEITNFGLSASKETTVKIYDSNNTLVAQSQIASLAPYETIKAEMTANAKVKAELPKFIVVYMVDNKVVFREDIPNDQLTESWGNLKKEIYDIQQLLENHDYTKGRAELQNALDTALLYLGSYTSEEINLAIEKLIAAKDNFKTVNGIVDEEKKLFKSNISYYFKNASSTAKQVYIQKPSMTSATDNYVYRTSSKTNAAELAIAEGSKEGSFVVRDVETGLYLSGKGANGNGGQWTFDSTPVEVVISDNTYSKQSSWALTGDADTFYVIGNGGEMYANAYKASSGDKVQSYRAADQGSQWYILPTGKTIDTGIAEIYKEQGDIRYFTLSGIPVANPQNGIYIECKANSVTRKIVVD